MLGRRSPLRRPWPCRYPRRRLRLPMPRLRRNRGYSPGRATKIRNKPSRRSVEGIMRYQSKAMIGDIPVLCVAVGPDMQSQQVRGRAVGVIAVGDVAVGIIAVGALAAGVIAIGGLGFGVISVGGVALGLIALGGLAIGGVAVGGLAVGIRSLGGLAIGPHPTGGMRIYWPSS